MRVNDLFKRTNETNGKETNDKLLAVNTTEKINDYVSLFCLAKRINKSVLMRNILRIWYDAERELSNEEFLINKFVKSVREVLEQNRIIARTERRIEEFEDLFFKDLKRLLKKQNISQNTINKILSKLDNEKSN